MTFAKLTVFILLVSQQVFGQAPIVKTTSATLVTTVSATLNASANPDRSETVGWFRYSTIHPGTPDDAAGTRAPSTRGYALGMESSDVDYADAITGLMPSTTYYYWAIAENAFGLSFGSIESFTTLSTAPVATTHPATFVTGSTATLHGSGNPNGSESTGWFRYATINPGTPDDVAGTRAPLSGGSPLGGGSSTVNFNRTISGLAPGTTYYYWAIVSNLEGISFGSIASFTTPTSIPSVSTSNATLLTTNSVTIHGTANPNGNTSTGWFRYSTISPGTGDDASGTRVPASGGTSLGAGTSMVAFSQPLTGLAPNTVYYYWAIASNGNGTSFGNVTSFKTLSVPPAVTTNAATSITNNSASLNASGTPNGDATTGWFRYSSTNPGSADDVSGTRAPTSGGSALGSGTSAVTYNRSITGLSPATTYYYWAVVSNAAGTAFGSIQSFTTTAVGPTVSTDVASVTGTTVILNGDGKANGTATTAWFRYSTLNPGTGNDASGIRVPSTGGTSLGSGTSSVSFTQTITGLTAGTTYYYWAIASNSVGTAFGTVQMFTTGAASAVTGNVGIGTTSPDGSAQLEVSSTTRGFLPPRMTAAQRDAISSPGPGLMIYCSDCGGGEIQVYNNFGWTNLLGNGPSGPLATGDNFMGGKVAYIFQPGDSGYVAGETHGLIAAASDLTAAWGCFATTITGGDGFLLGTGNQNTIDIMAGCPTPGIAARVCGDLVLNGFNDWYLPSRDELNKLYMNRASIGGFSGIYWSSTEFTHEGAWGQSFTSGNFIQMDKRTVMQVRAVRQF